MQTVNPKSFYSIAKNARIDPKFIGIAEIYAQHKKTRLQYEEEHRKISNSLTYAIKTFTTMEKTLEDKSKQLKRLENMKERHQNDHQKKEQFQSQKRRKQQQLRRRSTKQRQRLKFNIRQKLSQLKQTRKKQKQQMKQQSRQRHQQLSQKYSTDLQRRHMMYSTIKQHHQQCDKKVDEYYRQKNIQSLNNYMNLIKSQDRKKELYEQNITRMNKTLTSYGKRNDKKHKRLLNLDMKISQLNPLETFYSTRLGDFKNSRGKSYLGNNSRISSSMSVKSKKPIQILLDNDIDDDQLAVRDLKSRGFDNVKTSAMKKRKNSAKSLQKNNQKEQNPQNL